MVAILARYAWGNARPEPGRLEQCQAQRHGDRFGANRFIPTKIWAKGLRVPALSAANV
jgi:hypothetical protein